MEKLTYQIFLTSIPEYQQVMSQHSQGIFVAQNTAHKELIRWNIYLNTKLDIFI